MSQVQPDLTLNDLQCCICTNVRLNIVQLHGHYFCRPCIDELFSRCAPGENPMDPLTRQEFTWADTVSMDDIVRNLLAQELPPGSSNAQSMPHGVSIPPPAESNVQLIPGFYRLGLRAAGEPSWYRHPHVRGKAPEVGIDTVDGELVVTVCPSPGMGLVNNGLIVIAVDSSGSMDTRLSNEIPMTRMELAKHAAKSIVASLPDGYDVCVFAFSIGIEHTTGIVRLSNRTRSGVMDEIDRMGAGGQTNIYGALEYAAKRPGMTLKGNNAIILLTDGIHNFSGNVLSQWRSLCDPRKMERLGEPRRNFSMHLLAFGYSPNSALLYELSKGMGQYAMISDVSMMGITLSDIVANVLRVVATDVTICLGHIEHGEKIKLRPLLCGQHVTVRLGKVSSPVDIFLTWKDSATATDHWLATALEPNPGLHGGIVDLCALDVADLAAKYVPHLPDPEDPVTLFGSSACDWPNPHSKVNLGAASADIRCLMDKFSSIGNEAVPGINALVEDLSGEMRLAVSNQDNWDRWGWRFFYQCIVTHQSRYCMNRRNVGSQLYAVHPDFLRLRDKFEECYTKKVEIKIKNADAATVHRVRSAVTACDAGCWSSECMVLMSNDSDDVPEAETWMKAGQLIKGDRVRLIDGDTATVEFVLLTDVRERDGVELVQTEEGLLITPWHPVRIGDTDVWEFPRGSRITHKCDYLVSILLDHGRSINVEGVWCATLGHGILDDKVVSHPFFGDRAAVTAAIGPERMRSGSAMIKGVKRDPETRLVNGFAFGCGNCCSH